MIIFVSVHLRKASWKVLMLPYPYSIAMGTRHHARLVIIYQFNGKWPGDNVKKCVAIPRHWLNTVVIIINIPRLPMGEQCGIRNLTAVSKIKSK